MQIVPRNKAERDILSWAVDGLTSTGWQDSTILSFDCEISEEEAIATAAIIDAVKIDKDGILYLPDTNNGKWVFDDLIYRIGTQLPDMERSHIEQLWAEGNNIDNAERKARRYLKQCVAFANRLTAEWQ